MTHTPETGAINRNRFLAPLCAGFSNHTSRMKISGAENKRVKVVLYSVHCCALHWTDKKCGFVNYGMFILLCSTVFLSGMHAIFWLGIEHCCNRRLNRVPCRWIQSQICMTHAAETGAGKMELIYDAGFWSVCHGYKQLVQETCTGLTEVHASSCTNLS